MHNHAHGHDHSHVSSANLLSRAFVIGIVLNTAFVVAEVIAGLFTHSIALLTDAGHNLSDVLGLFISLMAFKLVKIKPSNANAFTYGYRKTTILAALINAIILIVACGILGYESILRFNKPEVINGGIMAWVAGVGIAINGLTAFFFFADKDRELNAKGAYLHMMGDALVSLGVVIAGIIIKYTDWYWMDSALGLIVIAVILISTWSLLKDSILMSIDAVPRDVDYGAAVNTIENVDGVRAVHHVHIWALSTTQNALTAHVVFDNKLSFDQKIQAVKEIKHELEHSNIHHATIEMVDSSQQCKLE